MKRLRCAALAPLAFISILAFTAPARAQMSHVPVSDWRQADRSEALSKTGSGQQFTFELRFGQYFPEVDDKPGLATNSSGQLPYRAVFGHDEKGGALSNDQFYFGVEVDYLPFRVPYVGAIGPGFGWGFTTTSNKARAIGGTTDSATDTSFTIMPMHLSAVVRFDELMRRTGIPIVPFAKFGLGMGVWLAGPVPSDFTGTGATWGSIMPLVACCPSTPSTPARRRDSTRPPASITPTSLASSCERTSTASAPRPRSTSAAPRGSSGSRSISEARDGVSALSSAHPFSLGVTQ